jgi:pilus assembly protein Flp/PilA
MLELFTKFQIRLMDLNENLKEDRGATAVEYGLMVALIAVVIIAAVTAIGTRLNGIFETVRDALPAG